VPITVTRELRNLLRRATPEQLNAARRKAIDYFLACRLADVQPEAGDRIMRESLEVELLEANETPAEYDDTGTFTSRNYASVYCGGYDVDQRTISYRRAKD
jgi:hypothetical protein